MRHFLMVLACLVCLVFSTVPVYADEGRPVPKMIPATLTAAQIAANAQKLALARQAYAEVLSGKVVHRGDPAAYANIYKEPQEGYAPNWCGAGVATVLIAGWQIKRNGYDSIGSYSRYSNPGWGTGAGWFSGGEAFMQHLAYDDDVVQDGGINGYPGISEPSRDKGADFSDETHVANGANSETASLRSGFLYVVYPNVGNVTNFRSVLNYDIAIYQVPFAAVAKPCPSGAGCLTGWTGAPTSMNHWQSIGAYDTGTDQLTYGDSASTAQGWGGDPWYWHYWGIIDYFNTHMLPYRSGTVVW